MDLSAAWARRAGTILFNQSPLLGPALSGDNTNFRQRSGAMADLCYLVALGSGRNIMGFTTPGLARAAPTAAWTSLLFVVYPGFGQQFIALVYSHFFIVSHRIFPFAIFQYHGLEEASTFLAVYWIIAAPIISESDGHGVFLPVGVGTPSFDMVGAR
jgi:hypothetical protein